MSLGSSEPEDLRKAPNEDLSVSLGIDMALDFLVTVMADMTQPNCVSAGRIPPNGCPANAAPFCETKASILLSLRFVFGLIVAVLVLTGLLLMLPFAVLGYFMSCNATGGASRTSPTAFRQRPRRLPSSSCQGRRRPWATRPASPPPRYAPC